MAAGGVVYHMYVGDAAVGRNRSIAAVLVFFFSFLTRRVPLLTASCQGKGFLFFFFFRSLQYETFVFTAPKDCREWRWYIPGTSLPIKRKGPSGYSYQVY